MAAQLHGNGHMLAFPMLSLLLPLVLAPPNVRPPLPDGRGPPAPQQAEDFWTLEWQLAPAVVAPTAKAPPASKGQRALGASLYRQHCAACHGRGGAGDGRDAARLTVRPTDFTQGVYKLRSTPMPSLPTDLDLFATLTRGIHGTPMRPWRQLDERDRWALVAQLKSFSPRFRTERPQSPINVPPPPPETAELRARGKRLYRLMDCASCHGETGAADGPVAAEIRQLSDDGVVGVRDFTRGRFIRGAEMTDLFLTIQTGLHGTLMGGYRTLLSEDETWAMAAYVRSLILEHPLNAFPPARALGARSP